MIRDALRVAAAAAAVLATAFLAGELVVVQPVAAHAADADALAHLVRWRLAAATGAVVLGAVGWSIWAGAARRRETRRRAAVIGMVAHDIRGPLTGIRLAAERGDAAVVDREVERLAALADDLLDACGAAGRGVEPLCDVLEDVTRRVHAPVELRVAPEVRGALVDRSLARAVGNIAENAARHARHAPVAIVARPAGGGVEITVADDGDGFPVGFRVAAFRSGLRPGRAGLGLASAIRTVRRVGGSVAFATRDGGSVSVRVPR